MGSQFRPDETRKALKAKNVGNRALFVPEPANWYDPNAIAIFTPTMTDDGQWVHVHVGYVQKEIAAAWMTGWPHEEDGKLRVVEGEFTRTLSTPEVTANSSAWSRNK